MPNPTPTRELIEALERLGSEHRNPVLHPDYRNQCSPRIGVLVLNNLPAILTALRTEDRHKAALEAIMRISSKPTYPGNNCRDITDIARQALAGAEQ